MLPILLRRVGFALLAAVISLVAARSARAQARVLDAITPPKPLAPLVAQYPEGAAGDQTVVVVVTIDAGGAVQSARIASGAEPFASAVQKAAAHWRFEPATLDKKPIASSIRVQIRFTAPLPPIPRTDGGSTSAPTPAPPPRVSPLEVEVRGAKIPPAARSLSKADVDVLPGAFGDPLRAIEVLPGVAPLASGIPYFFVRGAPPGNVGYYLDGVRVPLLFHIGAGPSVIHPDLIDRVDVLGGPYPASFGRFVGGIVTAETREPRPEWHEEVTVRLIDAGARLEGPIADGRGALFVAGRYSYAGAVLSLVSPTVALGYWDYQVRADFQLTARDRIGVFAFGAHDNLGIKDEIGPQAIYDSTFHRIDLRYDRSLGGPDDRLRAAVTFGFDRSTLRFGSADARLVSGRFELSHALTDRVILRAGFSSEIRVYKGVSGVAGTPTTSTLASFAEALIDGFVAGSPTSFAPHTAFEGNAYLEYAVRIGKHLELRPGVRVELFASNVDVLAAADPRLSASITAAPDLRFFVATGLAAQPPSFLVPIPGVDPDLQGGLQRSFQASAGVEADLPAKITASATVYETVFFNATDPLGADGDVVASVVLGSDTSAQQRFNPSSIGLELSAKRRLSNHLGGLVSYTLSRTSSGASPLKAPATFDRTHVFNVAALYDFGHGIRGGTRLLFYTGTPAWTLMPSSLDQEYRRAGRLRPFFRLDARLEKRWSFRGTRHISAVVEVQNALFASETVETAACFPAGCRIGPVTLPNAGIEVGY